LHQFLVNSSRFLPVDILLEIYHGQNSGAILKKMRKMPLLCGRSVPKSQEFFPEVQKKDGLFIHALIFLIKLLKKLN
jgi:hypothetical protein